jgi:micrococcal nuclease
MKVNRVKVSRVVSVYDGDSFRCDVDSWPKLFGYHIPIRIRGIDCPEKRKIDGRPVPLAVRAQEFTETALINASEIILEDVTRGKYFRLVANVLIDGRDLGQMLLSEGLAVRYLNK